MPQIEPVTIPEAGDCMIDIESLGRRPFCPLLSIGACSFYFEVPEGKGDPLHPANIIEDVFYVPIDLESCLAVGLRIDADTLRWWMLGDAERPENSPTDEARVRAFGDPNAMKLPQALDAFTTWLNSRPLKMWGNSARFDLGIIEAAYVACGKEPPWAFYNERCYRTVKNIPAARDIKLVRVGTHHNAVDDATSQALHLHAINCQLQLHL